MISSDWQSQIFEKKNGGLNLGQIVAIFKKFSSLVFHEIAYNDSLQVVEVKLTKKILGDQMWAKTGQYQAQN